MVHQRAIVIPEDMRQRIYPIEFDEDVHGKDLIKGLIEPINLDNPDMTMLVNEEGTLLDLAVNHRATAFAWFHHPWLMVQPPLRGSAIIMGRTPNGLWIDIPVEMEAMFFDWPGYRIRAKFRRDRHGHVFEQIFVTWYEAYLRALASKGLWLLTDEVTIVNSQDGLKF